MSFRKAPEAKKAKEHVTVALRIAPDPQAEAGEEGIVEVDGAKVTFVHTGLTDHFVFDHVFRGAGQQEVFDTVGEPMVQDTMHGYNTVVFAYGATGTGKTHSVLGTEAEEGLLPRVARRLFHVAQAAREANSGNAIKIELSVMDIFHDKLYDLLQHEPGGHQGEEVGLKRSNSSFVRSSTLAKRASDPLLFSELLMKEDKDTKAYFVPDVTYHDADEFEQFQQLVHTAISVRDRLRVPEEIPNNSCLVYSIHVHQKQEAKHHEVKSRILVMDLAGSEKQYLTDYYASGEKAVKVPVVNTNMNVLHRCITAVAEHLPTIPIKESVATRFLAEVLYGSSRGLMLAHATPGPSEETAATLNLAAQARKVRTEAKRHVAGRSGADKAAKPGDIGPRQSSLRNVAAGPKEEGTGSPAARVGDLGPRQGSARNAAATPKEEASPAVAKAETPKVETPKVAEASPKAQTGTRRDSGHVRVATVLKTEPKLDDASPKGHPAGGRRDSSHGKTTSGAKPEQAKAEEPAQKALPAGAKMSSPAGPVRTAAVRKTSGALHKPGDLQRRTSTGASKTASPKPAAAHHHHHAEAGGGHPAASASHEDHASPAEDTEWPPVSQEPAADDTHAAEEAPAEQPGSSPEHTEEASPPVSDEGPESAHNSDQAEGDTHAADEDAPQRVPETVATAPAPAAAAVAPSQPPPHERKLSFQSSSYLANLENTPPPKYVHELMVAVQTLVDSYAISKGIDADKVELFIKDLQQQVLYQPIDGLTELQAAATQLWTSSSQLEGEELATLLNRALVASDADLAHPLATLVHSINQLRVSATHRPEEEPEDNVVYRTGTLPDKFQGFFREGAKFRVPNFLSTYFQHAPAIEVVGRRPLHPKGVAPVLWQVHLDPKFGCFHVNFVKKPGEEEYLFPPYSVMTVETVQWSSEPCWQDPHIIHLSASVDNEGEPDVLPVAPWV